MSRSESGHALLTIAIPTFNNLHNLEPCLKSIRGVLGPELGRKVLVHVQDGGSSDGTEEFLSQSEATYLTYSIERDQGVYDAMNRATFKIKTKWIYFMGGDDRLLPDFMEALRKLKGQRIYYANVRYSSDDRRYDGRFTPLKLIFRNICHQSMFFPTEVLLNRPYSLTYPIKSDWAHNIVLMKDYPFAYLALDVARFTDTGGLSSTTADSAFEANKAKLFKEYHGYLAYYLCRVAPDITRIYQRLTGRAKHRRPR
jgi:glycosyltransferase involved in cell wall biosynthesis